MSTDHIYEGDVIGDRHSYVFGSIHNGVFEGKIITERDAYYVEHAKHYFPTNRTTTTATASTSSSTTTGSTTRRSTTIKSPDNSSHNNNNNKNNNNNNIYNNNKTAIDNKTENFINKNAEITSTTLTTFPMLPESTTMFTPTTDSIIDQVDENDAAQDELDFHSIIYKESHVEDAYENVREGKSTKIYYLPLPKKYFNFSQVKNVCFYHKRTFSMKKNKMLRKFGLWFIWHALAEVEGFIVPQWQVQVNLEIVW